MAIITRAYVVDDLDAKQDPSSEVIAERTVRFAVEGAEYEIDLTVRHCEEFFSAILPYREAGRRVRQQPKRPRTAASRASSAKVRTWAKSKGYEVNDRGRVPASIVAEYEAMQPA